MIEVALLLLQGSDLIPRNEGKKFEDDIRKSVPDACWIYRLRDNASSFSGGNNTRFTSSNICDYIMMDDNTRTLYLLELKSTKSTSMPFGMIHRNQIDGLLEAGRHMLIPGIIANFRNEHNDTFFIPIGSFFKMAETIGKKSFNVKDLESIHAVRIYSKKKRTRYKYDIEKFIQEVRI